jgi:hypothetical protein
MDIHVILQGAALGENLAAFGTGKRSLLSVKANQNKTVLELSGRNNEENEDAARALQKMASGRDSPCRISPRSCQEM